MFSISVQEQSWLKLIILFSMPGVSCPQRELHHSYFSLFIISLWLSKNYLTVSKLRNRFWFLSSSCFFLSILASRLASSDAILSNIWLVFFISSLTKWPTSVYAILPKRVSNSSFMRARCLKAFMLDVLIYVCID